MILDILKSKSVLLAFGLVIGCAFFFGFVLKASAYDDVELSQLLITTQNTANIMVQYIIPDEDFHVNYLELYKISGSGYSTTTDILICKGDNASSTLYACGIGDTLEASWLNQTFPEGDWSRYETISTVTMNSGESYYIKIYNSAGPGTFDLQSSGASNPYPAGKMLRNQSGLSWEERNEDLAFKLIQNIYYTEPDVEIIELGEPDEFWVIIASEEFNLFNTSCISGEDCYLKLNYPFGYQDDTVNLYRTDISGNIIELATSTTLSDSLLYQRRFLLENQTAGTKYYYIAWNSDELTNTNIATVEWYDEEDYLDEEYNIEDACADMATSSDDSFWDGMRYGIECGIRKVAYWSFKPKPSTFVKLDNAKEEIMQEFPFRIFSEGKSIIETASTSASSTWSIPVNWIASGTTLTTMDFNSQKVQDNYGLLWEKFMLMQMIVFYLAAILIIFKLGLKILKL